MSQLTQLSLSLESVKSDFIKWRNNPERPNKIPEALWDKVMLLLPHYTKRKVLHELGINNTQLVRKLKSRDTTTIDKEQSLSKSNINSNSFIKAIVAPQAQMQCCDIVLIKNGATLQINKLSHDVMLALAGRFMEQNA